MIVDRCLTSSPLFGDIEILRLTENMRLKVSQETHLMEHCDLDYPEFLLKVGEGRQEKDSEGRITLPNLHFPYTYRRMYHAARIQNNTIIWCATYI